jgi:ariadne-1
LSTTKTRLILNKYKWNINEALIAVFDLKEEKSVSPSGDAEQCEICFEGAGLQTLPCGHIFCNECIKQYIFTIIKEESGFNLDAINCPGYKCNSQLEDEFVLDNIANDKIIQSKYIKMITKNYVMNCEYIKMCPREHCSNVIKIEEGEISETFAVCCSCCNWFCFQCQTEAHDPLSCEMAEHWKSYLVSDVLTNDWIINNTKKCPNCHSNIEKNGGCMHMTCRSCKYEFCWICFAKWDNHHNCDRNSVRNTNGNGGGPTTFIRRFEHFNSHYQNMSRLIKRDQKLQELLDFQDEIEVNDKYIKTKFVKTARETLHKCRSTLMYSYAFEYSWTSIDNRINMFEHCLTSLETCTEKLSNILWNLSFENLYEKQPAVVDATIVSRRFCKSIIDYVKEGEVKGWWLKFPPPADHYFDANNNGFEF